MEFTMETAAKSEKKKCGPKERLLKIHVVFLSVLLALAVVCIIVLTIFLLKDSLEICDSGYPVQPRNLEHPSVFDSLTPKEYAAVKKYLFKVYDLNLVELTKGTPVSAYIFMIDLLLPPKFKVLEHLDEGLTQPERKAWVVIFRGDLPNRAVEEYEVGPLPNPNYHTKINKKRIPYTFKPMDNIEYDILFNIINETCELLYPLLMESYSLAYHNCTDGLTCMAFYDIAPRGTNDIERRSWFCAFRNIEGFYLHPLGLEIQIDHSGRNAADWKVLQIVYNGQTRPTAQMLFDDYKLNKITKIKIPLLGKEESLYSSYQRRGKKEMNKPLQGPKLVEPDGHRYQVNGMHVTYMHWDMNINTKASTGVHLFDIRFQGKRIAYELSLQEACVFYSGYGPSQSITSYYDVSWLMGAYINELVPGVDCPETSTFLDVETLINTEKPVRIKKGICIFEDHAEVPLRRHYASDFHGSYHFYGGLGDYRMIIRSIANVWNYDYIFDYVFHLSGAVEVKVYATGYVGSAFPLEEELQYGSKITSFMMANIHHHLFNYKVDIDINGRSNVYSTLDISNETIQLPWYTNFNKTQLKFELNKKSTEDEANFQPKHEPRYDIFYNDKLEDNFKNKQAYRIINLGKSPFLLSESSEANGAKWAKYDIAVSKYKDEEFSSTSMYAQNGPRNPIVDFDDFISDNDTILNEDLIAWVTMGVLHIPHKEDIPSTSTAGSQVRFYLVPFNYFGECPSMSSPNAIHITPVGPNDINLNTFGTSHKSSCVQKEHGPSTYNGRLIDV